ncbi:uncharacterized protein [Aegilops tauschii subsp. strangulata]|uniref:uncharacterized protein n=1 Tax=Aegilops tauschii subsp. strangulata TaxID=200361 RepID=UPI003CC86E45
MTDDPSVMYKLYTSELDTITAEQVEWEPYGRGDSFGNPREFRLNPMCTRDRDLWHTRCPLICNWAVELHLPHRVYRQFGLFQPHLPEWEDTDKLLHALDRRKQRKVKDWDKHHRKYVIQFTLSVEQAKVCKPAYAEEILEDPTVFDELTQHQYNKLVREGASVPSAPMMNFVRAQIKKEADETETILETTPVGKSDGEGALQAFIKVADDMTLGTYQVRSAYELKTRKGINKYRPEDFTQRGKRTVGTSRMATLDDYVDDMEEPEPEPERVALPRKAKKIASRRGEEPKSA